MKTWHEAEQPYGNWPTPYQWLDTWERPRLITESCSGFTGPPSSKMWEPTVSAVPSARKHHMGESIHTLGSYTNSAGTFHHNGMDILGPLPPVVEGTVTS